MSPRHASLVAAALLATACNSSKPPPAPECVSDDDCAAPAFCDAIRSACATLEVALRGPRDGTVTACRDPLVVGVRVGGADQLPRSVELFSDGRRVTELWAPSYELEACRTLGDGAHSLTARASMRGRVVESAPVHVTVDTTGPKVLELRPDPSATELPDVPYVELVVDEPLDPDSWVFVGAGGGVHPAPVPGAPNTYRVGVGISLRAVVELSVDAQLVDALGNTTHTTAVYARQPPVTVDLEVPRPIASPYVSGIVPVSAVIGGSVPDRVVLRLWRVRDGHLDTFELEPPAYRFDWDTAAFEDGQYDLHAVAYRGSSELWPIGTYWSRGTDAVVDHTPPNVTLSRAPGSLRVGDGVRVEFSADVRRETVPGAVRLTDAAGHDVPFTYDDPATPNSLWFEAGAAPQRLRLELTDAIEDAAGNRLVPAAYTWDVPAWLVQSAADPAGRALRAIGVESYGLRAIWEASSAEGAALYDGDPGNSPAPLAAAGTTFTSPSVVRTGSRWQLLGWAAPSATGTQVVVQRRPAAWDPWEPVGAPIGGDARTPVVIGTAARPFVAWIEAADGGLTGALRVARFADGVWIDVPSPTDATAASRPVGVMGASGRLYVAWLEGGATASPRIRAAAWHETTGWILDTEPIDGGAPTSAPTMDLAADDEPIVAWTEDVAGVPVVRVARRTYGGWSRLADVPATDGAVVSEPSIGVDLWGRPGLVFLEDGAARRVVRAARYEGAAWVDLGSPSAVGEGAASAPVIDADAVWVNVPRLCAAWTEGVELRFGCYNE